MSGWNEERTTLLKKWTRQCSVKAHVHDLSAKRYSTYTKVIDLPVVVLSVITTSSLLIGIGNSSEEAQYAIASVSLLGTVLSAASSFLSLGKRRDAHRQSSITYSSIALDVSEMLSRPVEERDVPQGYISNIRKRIEQLDSTSPLIPQTIADRYIRNVTNHIDDLQLSDMEPQGQHRGMQDIESGGEDRRAAIMALRGRSAQEMRDIKTSLEDLRRQEQ